MSKPVICFSHLRWDFVYQRPNHLMARAAHDRRVYFVEEPIADPALEAPQLELIPRDGVTVVRFRVPEGLSAGQAVVTQAGLLRQLVATERIHEPVAWYYTPMALRWSEVLDASAVVYDCMDELSAFRGAPPGLLELERRLLQRADLVFTGGRRLFEAKRDRHPSVHLFPSSVDQRHFAQARHPQLDPADQAGIPHPRLGYFGVIDERLDLALLDAIAVARPAWQIVLVGPTAKIDPADLPDRPNVHHLGMKAYDELPGYLAGWEVALMPFARNEATRFISPTKTPEYLAGGRPVVSTSIDDVVEPYGRLGLARIADDAGAFVEEIEDALAGRTPDLERVDAFLARSSWDRTWSAMAGLLEDALARRVASPTLRARERLPRLASLGPARRAPAGASASSGGRGK